MKRLMPLAVALVGLALAGAADAQMRVPYSNALTLEIAKKCLTAAEAESKKNNWNMAIAVVDSGNNLVAFQKMDNTQLGSVHVAMDKATSANGFRRPSKAFEDALAGGRQAILGLRGAAPIEGGIPLVIDGKIIGAVGVSGELAGQDGQVAKACADTIGK
jgi:glc operon protein GlcG